MNFIYGKQDWLSFERGEETCFLMANGLGGFCSLTAIGSCARNEHGLLMACERAPNRRVQMIQRLEDTLALDGRAVPLSSQDFGERARREDGRAYQAGFTFRDYPQWTYLVQGVEVVKRAALMPGENTVALVYEINNRSRSGAVLRVTPHLRFVPKGEALRPGQQFTLEKSCVRSNGRTLYFQTSGRTVPLPQALRGAFHFAQDAMDGKPVAGWAVVNHCVELSVPAGESRVLEAVYGTAWPLPGAEEVFSRLEAHNRALERRAGLEDGAARALVRAAGQFLSRRESTGGHTILAGFPFFEDWGRDTMIALPGCLLSTGRYKEARSVLETFLAYERDGLAPNLFPEGGEEPRYNTADAALLLVNCVWLYWKKTGDAAFVKRAFPVLARIAAAYQRGTRHAIRMDGDGLICAGEGLDQVTWMDVCVDGILPPATASRWRSTPIGITPCASSGSWPPGRGGRGGIRRFGPAGEGELQPSLLDGGQGVSAGCDLRHGGGRAAALQPDLGGVHALFRPCAGAGAAGGGSGVSSALHPLRPAHPGPRRRGVPALLRRRPAEAGSGLPSGHRVGLPPGGLLSGVPEGERLLPALQGHGPAAAGGRLQRPAGGLRRTAARDLRRRRPRNVQGLLCPGVERGGAAAGL